MTKHKTSERVLDFFFILGTVLVLFPHFSKDYIPSFLFPFFGSDMVLSIYPFFIFSLLAIFLLFQKGEYKKILLDKIIVQDDEKELINECLQKVSNDIKNNPKNYQYNLIYIY